MNQRHKHKTNQSVFFVFLAASQSVVLQHDRCRSNQPPSFHRGITDKGLIRKKSLDEEHFAPRCIWLRSECQTQVVQILQQPSVRNLFRHCLCENETDVLHSALTLLLSKESMPQCFNAHTPILTFITPTPSRRWLFKEGSHNKTWRHYAHHMTSNTMYQKPWQLHLSIQAEVVIMKQIFLNTSCLYDDITASTLLQ